MKTLKQIRQQVAQYLGIQDSNGDFDFDETTRPTKTLVETFINDTTREISASWDFPFNNKVYEIPNIIHTSMEEGMVPLDKTLALLVKQGVVELETAQNFVLDNEYFLSLIS